VPTTVTTAGPDAPAGAATEPPSPMATRVGAPRWLDLRLVVGVLLVLGSVVVGARVVAAADDTVPLLVAAQDLTVDRPLTATLVQTRQVLLEDGLARYLSGDVPEGYVMVRPVEAGELVPRTAVAPADEVAEDLRYVTLALPAAELPAGLRAGRVVDVWVAPDGETAGALAELLLAGITVTDVGGDSGGLGVSGTERAVTLAVTAGVAADTLEEAVARLVAAARDARVYLAAVPGGSQGLG